MPLPPRQPGGGNLFTDFAGGGYFYLDNRDRAVIPTTLRHVFVVRQTGGGTRLRDRARLRPLDRRAAGRQDHLGAAGLERAAVVRVDERRRRDRRPEDRRGPLAAAGREDRQLVRGRGHRRGLHRHRRRAVPARRRARAGCPTTVWREPYENSGVQKPGQSSAGSGTTPTLMGAGLVAITDNADPMNVLVYRAPARAALICRAAGLREGRERHRPVADRHRPLAGGREQLRLLRPARDRRAARRPRRASSASTSTRGGGCHTAWRSAERAPSVVPKLSARNGLVYTYTKDPQPDERRRLVPDRARLRAPARRSTSASAARGSATTTTTRRSRSARTGPPTSATLGGLVALRDKTPPPGAGPASGGEAGEGCGGCGCTSGGWAASARGCG